MAPALRFRLAVAADAPTIARTMALGFDTYRAFGPIGWRPPGDMTALVGMRMATPGAWALLADIAGRARGSRGPARPTTATRRGPRTCGSSSSRPPWWGTGLADRLHAAFLEHAQAGGLRRGRDWSRPPGTPARGASTSAVAGCVDGAPVPDPQLGLALVVLRRGL